MDTAKIKALWQLTRMDKPIGSLLLLWPTLWALFLAAKGMPNLHVLTVFILGVLVMRAAGCVINDFADRRFDGHVKRTQLRPLPSGRVTTKEALALFFSLIFIALLLVLTLDPFTVKLSVIALLLAFVYPFMKRYIQMPQLVLGLAFSWAIPMAYVAQSGTLPPVAWMLFLANVCWIIAYDTLYAMVDRDDDVRIGIKSTAILFGRFDKIAIGVFQLITLLLLLLVGYLSQLAAVYYYFLLAASALFVYQHWLARTRDRDACFHAFLNNNYVGMLIFFGLSSAVVT